MATKHSAEIRLQMVKSLTGALYFLEGNVPFSPLRCEMRAGRRPTDRAIKRVSTRQKERERETQRTIAGGSDWPCCFSWRLQSYVVMVTEEDEEEGLVSVSWGRSSQLVCEPTSGTSPGGAYGWNAARIKYYGFVFHLKKKKCIHQFIKSIALHAWFVRRGLFMFNPDIAASIQITLCVKYQHLGELVQPVWVEPVQGSLQRRCSLNPGKWRRVLFGSSSSKRCRETRCCFKR